LALDSPINIHLTGCPHSCAQHYVGDIGLLAAKVPGASEDDQVEGYHLLLGGGFGPDAGLAREVYRDLKAEEVPPLIERVLKTYLAHRSAPDETFLAFSRRHDVEALKAMIAQEAAA
jgi:ferredoxin-nitrite reductase